MSRRLRTAAVLASVFAVAAGLLTPVAARADDSCTITWKGGSGVWTDPARWSPKHVPTADDVACIVRTPASGSVSVQVAATTDVDTIVLRGATLSVSPSAFLDVNQVVATDAVFTGGGTLRGSLGILDIRDSQLAGIHVSSSSRLTFGGQVLFTGGSTIDSSSQVDLLDGVRLVDGDGNGANHVALSQFPLYLTGSVFVGVPLGLTNVALLAQGDVVLASLDNLDADGTLHSTYARASLQLGASFQGSLTLPRSVTSIGRRVGVLGGDIRTPDGRDALRSVGSISGALYVSQQLVAEQPITVYGTLSAGAPLVAALVSVRAGARFTSDRVTGTLSCAGTCGIQGAHLGRLTLSPSATVNAELDRPITVDGAVKLGGLLDLYVPPAARPGDTFVLVTAGGGVTGTFGQVLSGRVHRTVTPGYQPRFVTGTLGTVV